MSARDCVLKTERLSRLGGVWKELFTLAQGTTPFVSYEWFRVLARNLLTADPEVLVFTERDVVKGIIPATIRDGAMRSVGDERVTDLNDMICVPGYERRIAGAIADTVRERGLNMDLSPLETDSGLVIHLKDFLPDVVIKKADTCPLLDLTATWGDYLDGLDGKSRHELRRKMRKVNGTVLHDVKDEYMNDLFRLMELSDNNKKRFLQPDILAFFKELADVFRRKNWLRVRRAVLDDRSIGMIFAFTFRERVYLYNMGFDPAYRSISPGIVTVALDIRSAISEGCKYYDFLRGHEAYKYRLGAKERYTVRITR
jgi:hypothetical protein